MICLRRRMKCLSAFPARRTSMRSYRLSNKLGISPDVSFRPLSRMFRLFVLYDARRDINTVIFGV